MAKIVRFNGNLVAPASAALGTERTLFGSVTQADDLTSQFTADLLRGWGIVGPSDQPALQDFNAMGYTLGQLHAYLHQVGVAEWNAGQEYHSGSIANLGGLLFASNINNNTGNDPGTSATQWSPVGSGSTSVAMTNSNVTLSALQAARPVIIITGALTANVQLIFPAYARSWQVINATTGNFTITCKTASGTGVIVSATQVIVGDGTNIYSPNSAELVTGVIGNSLNARMSVPSASATATFTASEVIVGVALGGRQYRISNVSAAINLATTGAGGMDTGAAPTNSWVALYAIYNPTTQAVALLAKAAGAGVQTDVYSGANMPAGYTASALVAVVPTNGSGQVAVCEVFGRETHFFRQAFSGAPPGAFTPLSLATSVPPNAKSVNMNASAATTGAAGNPSAAVSPSGLGQGFPGYSSFAAYVGAAAATISAHFRDIPLLTSQQVQIVASGPITSIVFNSYGYKI